MPPRIQLRHRVRRTGDQREHAAAPDDGVEARASSQRRDSRQRPSSAAENYAAQQASEPAPPQPHASIRPRLLICLFDPAPPAPGEGVRGSFSASPLPRLSPTLPNSAINPSEPLLEEVFILNNPFSVEGKVTIVTGGGTGIGESIAKEFALRGAPVLIASRKIENLERVRDEIRKGGGKCEMAQVDVRDAEQCDKMVAEAVKQFGRLDVLINNHGASITTPSMTLSPNGWRAVVGINLDGTFFCSKSAARQFIEQKSPGSIVNISSTAGVHGSSTMLPYAASKAGVIKLTESHAAEWGRHGIRVNCIAPGPVTTAGAAPRVWPNPKVKEAVARSRALQRFGRVEEIAFPCIFLASDASSYVTGSLLIVDGGAGGPLG